MTNKIYKLVGGGKTYYGSTKVTLGTRKSQHNYDYKSYMAGKKRYISSFEIIKHDDFTIELVEECTSDNILAREGFYIKNNECVNKRVAGRTKKEYYKDNEERMKAYKSQWLKDNRVRIKEKYHLDKDDINSKRRIRESTTEFKSKKSEHDRLYRLANKSKIELTKNRKVACTQCQKLICSSNLRRHIKTQH